jgi:dipeptidase E
VRLLLGSGGFGTGPRLAPWLAELASFLGPVRRVLFVPHALADHDGYASLLRRRWPVPGVSFEGLHRARDPRRAVREAQAVLVGGGNTFRLLGSMRRLGLLAPLRARVRRGLPYLGASAGTNLACPTIQTTNDMPIVHPGSFEALGLVPFQVNAHYFDGRFAYKEGGRWEPYAGETRDDRLQEFHEENRRPVLGLREGAWLRLEGRRLARGGGEARLFRRGRPPRSFRPGAELGFLLAPQARAGRRRP